MSYSSGEVVKLPIDVVLGSHPVRYHWEQRVTGRTVRCEGTLPQCVGDLILFAKAQAEEIRRLKRQVEELAELKAQAAAQAEEIGRLKAQLEAKSPSRDKR